MFLLLLNFLCPGEHAPCMDHAQWPHLDQRPVCCKILKLLCKYLSNECFCAYSMWNKFTFLLFIPKSALFVFYLMFRDFYVAWLPSSRACIAKIGMPFISHADPLKSLPEKRTYSTAELDSQVKPIKHVLAWSAY